MKKLLLMLAVVALTTLAIPVHALADAAAATADALNPGSNTIDLAPIASGQGGALYLGLAFAAAAIYKWLSKYAWFNAIFSKADYQKLVDPLLDQAVAFGVGQLTNANWLKIETKNAAIAGALNYAISHGGDILKQFGIGEDALKEKLAAKLTANGWDTQPGKWQG